jgi:hypothetical protein
MKSKGEKAIKTGAVCPPMMERVIRARPRKAKPRKTKALTLSLLLMGPKVRSGRRAVKPGRGYRFPG